MSDLCKLIRGGFAFCCYLAIALIPLAVRWYLNFGPEWIGIYVAMLTTATVFVVLAIGGMLAISDMLNKKDN